MKLDATDCQILSLLQKNGREAVTHIADAVGLSAPTVNERIKKLKEAEVIEGIHAVLNPQKLGFDISAIISVISESSEHYKEVINYAIDTPEVIQCFSTTGKGSHTLLVVTKNSQSLEKLLRTIQSWPSVECTETQIILSSYKISQNLNVAA